MYHVLPLFVLVHPVALVAFRFAAFAASALSFAACAALAARLAAFAGLLLHFLLLPPAFLMMTSGARA